MTLFWVVAAALLLLALWLVAGTLLRKPAAASSNASDVNLDVLRAQLRQLDDDLTSAAIDSAQHAQSRADIERRVLEEESVASAPATTGSRRGTLLLLLLVVPVLAVALYALLGNLRALSPEATLAATGEPTQQDIEALVARLAERMEKQPPGRVEDAEGWAMLGRTYAALQRFPQASQAFARALQLTPQSAQLLADQADVTAMQQGQSMRGEPARLVEQALQIDPKNLKALALAGSVAFEQKDFATAIKHWSAASALAPPDSDFAKGLQGSLAEAKAAQGGTGAAAGAAAAPAAVTSVAASGAAIGGASLSGSVRLAPELAARVSPDDTVFIFARAAEGPRMPLAILKRQARELPITFTLDDSQAMSPQMKLSDHANVVVGARISKSGNATPQSGDLQGQSGLVTHRAAQVDLLIDSVRP
jgi:cytochrome c-type biogenesis protein CcmH